MVGALGAGSSQASSAQRGATGAVDGPSRGEGRADARLRLLQVRGQVGEELDRV